MLIRPYAPEDCPEVAAVFFEAVHVGSAGFYSAAARRAWAGDAVDVAGWEARLAEVESWVCVEAGRVVGFMSLGVDLRYAYVAPAWRGRGAADLLHGAVVDAARARGLPTLRCEASHLARRFLERHGWRVVRAQEVVRAGVVLENFVMERG